MVERHSGTQAKSRFPPVDSRVANATIGRQLIPNSERPTRFASFTLIELLGRKRRPTRFSSFTLIELLGRKRKPTRFSSFTLIELLGRKRKPTRCASFTLIELLVVIAVISILAALLLPALARARRMSQSVTCKNQLKQMALAAHSYTSDYEEYLPNGLHEAGGWRILTAPYLGFTISVSPRNPTAEEVFGGAGPGSAFYCPSSWEDQCFQLPGFGFFNWGPFSRLQGTYGINAVLMRNREAPFSSNVAYDRGGVDRPGQARDPAAVIHYGDTPNEYHTWDGLNYFHDPLIYCYNYVGHNFAPPRDRHPGEGNYVFMDGHVSTVARRTLWAPDGGYWWGNFPNIGYFHAK